MRFPFLYRFLWFTACLFASLPLARNLEAREEFSGTTMGPIEYRVVIQDEVENGPELQEKIDLTLEQVNQLMSTYIDSSDVSRFNQSEADQWIEVDPLTLSVVKKSLEFSRLTDGAFDITVGPAVRLWRFGPEKKRRWNSKRRAGCRAVGKGRLSKP